MSVSKQRGTAGESAVVNYLRHAGWPSAERRALTGTQDKGDITGVPGITIEVKNTQKMLLSEWMSELAREMLNTGDDVGFIVAKKRGTTDVGEWYAITPMRVVIDLLKEAGYGS